MEASPELSADSLIHRSKPAPRGGWRRALFTATRGHVNPGDSKIELRRAELEGTVRRAAIPDGHQAIVVLGAQPGVGVTTTTLGLGSVMAAQRGDQVIAVDANVGRAPLSDRLLLRSRAEYDLDDLIVASDSVERYSDFSRFVARSRSGLDVLASRVKVPDRALSPVEHRRISEVLERYYSLRIVDGGSVVDQPALSVLLERATRLVLVAHPSREGGNRAATALDEITDLDYPGLASTALIALARTKEQSGVAELERQLSTRCHRALRIPEDTRLAHRKVVDPEQLRAPSMIGHLELVAEIFSGFEHGGRRHKGASIG
ncbi:MinD/ParA family ATP-binding protein [Halostreptopolyspora alba]|uniref:MinD/ParA family protein n=1 Tax=Halostreptopolyspora alba TaxID=2487137 RepID=A0A3N0E6W8_9ACTN|nr:hypothetical protein EFW17_15995 [Nocardiopsaceae bacterium YIM 96095]